MLDAMLLADYQLYIPLGLLGLFRWTSWFIRRLPAVLYQPFAGEQARTIANSQLTVVVPVYQEDPVLFRAGIESWLANGVGEVICVIDETDDRCAAIAAEYPIRSITTSVPGKRDALRRGWEAAMTPFVALVDSDTIWASNVADELLKPFQDPQIGGVGTRQNVLHPDTFWQRANDAYLDYRYFDEIASQTVAGQAVSCLSGRTAAYRRDALVAVTEPFMHETFLGTPCNSGDDKRLTTLMLERGYRTYMQRSARVWSAFPADGRTFFKQRLRWARNTWRSDLRALGSPWVYSHKFLAFSLADKAISSFTLLFSPIFLIVALVRGDWLVAAIISCWWLISRSLKYLPHFNRRPSTLLYMPLIIALSFVLAVLKIYALFTIRTHRWLTRDVEVKDGKVRRTSPPAAKEVSASSTVAEASIVESRTVVHVPMTLPATTHVVTSEHVAQLGPGQRWMQFSIVALMVVMATWASGV